MSARLDEIQSHASVLGQRRPRHALTLRAFVALDFGAMRDLLELFERLWMGRGAAWGRSASNHFEQNRASRGDRKSVV